MVAQYVSSIYGVFWLVVLLYVQRFSGLNKCSFFRHCELHHWTRFFKFLSISVSIDHPWLGTTGPFCEKVIRLHLFHTVWPCDNINNFISTYITPKSPVQPGDFRFGLKIKFFIFIFKFLWEFLRHADRHWVWIGRVRWGLFNGTHVRFNGLFNAVLKWDHSLGVNLLWQVLWDSAVRIWSQFFPWLSFLNNGFFLFFDDLILFVFKFQIYLRIWVQ